MRYYANGIAFIYDKNGKDFINKHLKQSFGCEEVVLNINRFSKLKKIDEFVKYFKILRNVVKNFLTYNGVIFRKFSGESKQIFYIHYRNSLDIQVGPDIKPIINFFD